MKDKTKEQPYNHEKKLFSDACGINSERLAYLHMTILRITLETHRDSDVVEKIEKSDLSVREKIYLAYIMGNMKDK
jgi:hypothetical protein